MIKLRFFIGLICTIGLGFLTLTNADELGGYIFLLIALTAFMGWYTYFHWKNM